MDNVTIKHSGRVVKYFATEATKQHDDPLTHPYIDWQDVRTAYQVP